MLSLFRSQSIAMAIVFAVACPVAAALAMVAPGPHGVPETFDPPRQLSLPIETVVLARMLASARDTDFTYSNNGRRTRVRYNEPTIQTAALTPVPTRTVDVTALTATIPVNRLPSLNPQRRRALSTRLASLKQVTVPKALDLPEQVVLPARKLAIGGTEFTRHPDEYAIVLNESPASQRASRTSRAPRIVQRHPSPATQTVVQPPLRKPIQHLNVAVHERRSTVTEQAKLTNMETGTAPYIPWAVRQKQAGAVRTGPVHGNPHLAPHDTVFPSTYKPGTVVVHVKEKRLYLIQSDQTARVYPIGTARGTLDILGATRVTTRRFMPTWTPTPNQRRRDPTLPRRVEAGPDNPLGIRALGLGWRYRLIHGTSDPASIGHARSDGCIRMLNDDVVDLFNRVKVGNRVLVLASASAPLTEWRPSGYQEYKPRKRWRRKAWRKKRWRSKRRYASRRGKRKRRR